MSKTVVVLIDSREQRPFKFDRSRVQKLDHGDYSVLGLESSGVVVERKSLDDFFGSFTKGRRRMAEKLAAMGALYSRSYLVVEAPMPLIMQGSTRSSVDPTRLVCTVLSICAECGVVPVFCYGREHAQDMTGLLLKRAHVDLVESARGARLSGIYE